MKKEFNLSDFLAFDKMISPTFLTVLYYFHLGATILASLWFIFKGLDTRYGGNYMVMGGLANLVIGPFLVRLLYELIIVLFKIHSRLVSIDAKTKGEGIVASPAFVSPSTPLPVVMMQPDVQAPPVTTPVTPPQVAAAPTQDFWNAETGEMSFAKPDFSNFSFPNLGNPPTGTTEPVGVVNFGDLTQRMPNWPVALAAVLVLFGVFGSYANAMGMSFSIKDSALGMFALLAALGMVAISAAGLKWLWFVVCYGITLLGSIAALLDDRSLFSYASKGREIVDTFGGLGGGNRFLEQASRNVPSVWSFMSFNFYLFILAMLFCGYWALMGKYQERGLATK